MTTMERLGSVSVRSRRFSFVENIKEVTQEDYYSEEEESKGNPVSINVHRLDSIPEHVDDYHRILESETSGQRIET